VIRRVYPLAGNEGALGHDLLADPDRRDQALKAIRSRRLTVAGPFELRQGGVGLVARLAVFRPDERGAEQFWGFVTVLIRLSDLLSAAKLERLEPAGYAYSLSKVDATPGELTRIARSAAALDASPVSYPVHVIDGTWMLQVSPVAGWGKRSWAVALEYVVVVAGALALAAVAWVLLGQRERLRREVAARTAEIARANAQLEADMAERLRAEAAARTAEEQLRHAQKMEAVGQLAGGVAHDFNNALTGILAHASLLSEELPDGTAARESADTIAAAAARAAELTKQLLGFARRGKLVAGPCDVNAVVRDVVRLLARTLDKRIRVVERLDERAPTVFGDSGQLQHAILNLAVNARDAMPDGGELRLGTAVVELDSAWCERHPGAVPGPNVAITVGDTGHGIPANVQERMFEPFFTTKGPGRGTGMGLSLVYGTIRAHGGTITVETDEGRGSTFTIHLPVSAAGAAATPSPGRSPVSARGRGTVLVVDDDQLPREAAARVLSDAGYDVHAVASGEEAVAWFRKNAAVTRAVVLDLLMPGMDGESCYQALRDISSDVRVVLVSGFDRHDRAEVLLERGVREFLPKPFAAADLTAAVDRATRHARGEAARGGTVS
jgi:signal transduction histidine kinase/ActR/RegA family two-component response regulator